MPNLKIHVNDALYDAKQAAIRAALPELRAQICDRLAVPASACQFAAFPVMGMEDLPLVAVELAIMPGPARTPEVIADLAQEIRRLLSEATGTHTAVRISTIDPSRYLALK